MRRRHPSGITGIQVFLDIPFGISVEHRSLLVDHRFESRFRSGQAGEVVAFRFQFLQEIIQRRNDFESGSRHGILARTFIIIDSYLFILVRKRLQVQIIGNHIGELREAARDILKQI